MPTSNHCFFYIEVVIVLFILNASVHCKVEATTRWRRLLVIESKRIRATVHSFNLFKFIKHVVVGLAL